MSSIKLDAVPSKLDSEVGVQAGNGLDWDAYAEYYDSMCEVNPSYGENIDLLTGYIDKWMLGDNPTICDLGAGTGNYIRALAERIPDAEAPESSGF